MSIRNSIAFITIVLAQLCWYSPCKAQFQFFGFEFGGSTSLKDFMSGEISLSYLRQFSAKHGLGAELILPQTLIVDQTSDIDWLNGTPWSGEAEWTRRQTPALALRYRFFVGNSFFLGSNLRLGAVREKCFLDRAYQESFQGYEILPIYYDYQLLNPYFRISGELGIHRPMGKWMFLSILAKCGPQFTFSRAGIMGEITTQPNGTQLLKSYHGVDFYGGVAIGLGVKL